MPNAVSVSTFYIPHSYLKIPGHSESIQNPCGVFDQAVICSHISDIFSWSLLGGVCVCVLFVSVCVGVGG